LLQVSHRRLTPKRAGLFRREGRALAGWQIRAHHEADKPAVLIGDDYAIVLVAEFFTYVVGLQVRPDGLRPALHYLFDAGLSVSLKRFLVEKPEHDGILIEHDRAIAAAGADPRRNFAGLFA
jgi:hypothetical protein